MKKNRLIVIDGIDGAGTTTQTLLLGQRIFENYKQHRVLLTREPTAGYYGAQIRRLLKRGKKPSDNARKFLELFVKDRKEHLKLISDFEGIIICDRHKYSTFAYQQAQGLRFDKIYQLHRNMIKPDLTIILDISATAALKRMAQKSSQEIFDKYAGFLEKVRHNYLKLPGQLKERMVVINGAKSRKKVAEQIWEKVKNLVE